MPTTKASNASIYEIVRLEAHRDLYEGDEEIRYDRRTDTVYAVDETDTVYAVDETESSGGCGGFILRILRLFGWGKTHEKTHKTSSREPEEAAQHRRDLKNLIVGKLETRFGRAVAREILAGGRMRDGEGVTKAQLDDIARLAAAYENAKRNSLKASHRKLARLRRKIAQALPADLSRPSGMSKFRSDFWSILEELHYDQLLPPLPDEAGRSESDPAPDAERQRLWLDINDTRLRALDLIVGDFAVAKESRPKEYRQAKRAAVEIATGLKKINDKLAELEVENADQSAAMKAVLAVRSDIWKARDAGLKPSAALPLESLERQSVFFSSASEVEKWERGAAHVSWRMRKHLGDFKGIGMLSILLRHLDRCCDGLSARSKAAFLVKAAKANLRIHLKEGIIDDELYETVSSGLDRIKADLLPGEGPSASPDGALERAAAAETDA